MTRATPARGDLVDQGGECGLCRGDVGTGESIGACAGDYFEATGDGQGGGEMTTEGDHRPGL